MSEACIKCGHKDFDNDGNCIYCLTYGVKWFKPGTVLDGRYEIKTSIKAGGMGAVYKGFDTRLSQLCAIKEMLNQEETDLEYMKKRFMEEAKLLADLRHNGIPRVTDYFTHQNRYYLIMDYLDGIDLFTYITVKCNNTGVDEKFVVKIGIDVCDILVYLHNQKPKPILHRDIKPSNIFLCNDGRIMLIDFGLARPVNPDTSTEKTIVGTMGYASLEQYQGQPEPRSDLYGLAAVMYFLLTAVQPGPLKFPPLKETRSDVSPWLEKIVKKALSLYPENRFASALEMKEVLEEKRDLGEFNDDSGDLEKVRKEFIEEEVSTSKKGLFAQKRVPKEQVKETALIISSASDVDRVIEMAEKQDQRALEPLIKLLNMEEFKAKHRKIVDLLGNFKDERVIEPLIKMLSSPDEIIRRYTPASLAKIGARIAIKDIGKLIKDPSPAVQKSALQALGDLTEKNIMDFLALFVGKNLEPYRDRFPEDKNLYFDTVEDLIVSMAENKNMLKCYVHLAVLYEIDGKYFEAETYMRKAIEIRKKDINLRVIYVKILMGFRSYEEAEENMRKILELKGDDVNFQLLYGEILTNLKKYQEAIELYDEIYISCQEEDIEHKLIELYYLFGKKLEQHSRDLALTQYKKALMLNPGYKEKDFFEALILFKSGRIKKSINVLKKYIDENPDGLWHDKGLKLMDEIKNSPFPGVIPWIKGLLD
ncbi:MAG: HEAT repeat domain-containing protein [Candidatus Eremiobacterota bacterium]